jgi:tripartite-type tricarboxylate transporter receptor subunit TctC
MLACEYSAPTAPIPGARTVETNPVIPSRRLVVGLLAVACAWPAAQAQTFPAKPIRVFVPFPPGGGTDVIAREVTQAVAVATGWTFVIENRPGAGGNFGIDAVAKSPADGYNIALGQTSNLSINPTLYAKMPYEVAKDLAPIVAVADAPLVLVTGANTKLKTMADALAAARARPGSLNFASPGNGTVSHLAGEILQQAAGVKFQHVPYKGAAQAMTDAIAGNVDLYVSSVPTLLGQIRQGKLRALAVTSTRRLPDLPEVPTLAEAGIRGADSSTWFGFVAPAGTPAAVIATLNAQFNKALKDPALVKKLAHEGADVIGGTPAQFDARIKTETVRWGQVVKSAGVRID